MTLRRSTTLRWIGAAVVVGLLLAALGPFGSYLNDGPAARGGYWIASTLLGLALYGGALRTANRLAPPGHRGRWLALVAATLLASVPEALVTRTVAFRLWPQLAGLSLGWPLWFAQTATLGLALTAVALFVLHRSTASVQAVAPPAVAARPADPLATDVLALHMEDHYVRVHTPGGSSLVLMPLGRAIEGMVAPGLRVHRSWWVARHAVTSVEGTSRAMRLHLSNGVVAPVARTAVTHLKAAGWLSGRRPEPTS